MNTKPLVTKYKFTKYKVSSIDTVEGAKHYRQQRSAHLGRRRHRARRCRRRRRRRCSVPEQLASLWPGITLLPVAGVVYFILITKHLLNTKPFFFFLGIIRDAGMLKDAPNWLRILSNYEMVDPTIGRRGSCWTTLTARHKTKALFTSGESCSSASKKCILILWCGVLIKL